MSPQVVADPSGANQDAEGPGPSRTLQIEGSAPPSGQVINLLRLNTLPPSLEKKIEAALDGLTGADGVNVRRVPQGTIRDDEADTFVLAGEVPNQVALMRAISLASQIVTGRAVGEDDVRVVADESGALSSRTLHLGGQTQRTNFFGGGGGGGGQSVFGGGGGANRLVNQIQRNLGRATVVEAAEGRILSFLEVQDLPRVRVDIRLYEVNRNRLREWDPNSVFSITDFNQGSLNPAEAARSTQGDQAPRVGGGAATSFQNVLSFLGGTLTNQTQFTSGRFAVDSILSLLERFGIARSLSSPSLTVLSGELAISQVGGEIPIPQACVPDNSPHVNAM